MAQPKSQLFRYKREHSNAILKVLQAAGFQRKNAWPALLNTITEVVNNSISRERRDAESPAPYAGQIEKRTARLVKALADATKALDSLPIEIPTRFLAIPIEPIDPLLWSSLRESERSAIPKLLTPERFRRLLAVVACQAASPRLVADVPKTGAPKDRAVHHAVRELWYVFEEATGNEPKVYPSSYGRNG